MPTYYGKWPTGFLMLNSDLDIYTSTSANTSYVYEYDIAEFIMKSPPARVASVRKQPQPQQTGRRRLSLAHDV